MNLDEMTNGVSKSELVYLREMQVAKNQSNVLKVIPEKRTHAYLLLDKTIFHPKGGGQPSDRGRMTSPECVLDVKKAIYHRGIVVHWAKIVSGTPSTGPILCELDWTYRQLVMRRHTAAHLLDHCLAKITGTHVETTDSWLDAPCYVGYKGNAPNAEKLKSVQELANNLIESGARVSIEFVKPEQANAIVQKSPNFERLPDLDEVRLVTIEGCDPIACGGTHVEDIMEIGKLEVPQAEEVPNGFRLHFSVES